MLLAGTTCFNDSKNSSEFSLKSEQSSKHNSKSSDMQFLALLQQWTCMLGFLMFSLPFSAETLLVWGEVNAVIFSSLSDNDEASSSSCTIDIFRCRRIMLLSHVFLLHLRSADALAPSSSAGSLLFVRGSVSGIILYLRKVCENWNFWASLFTPQAKKI